VKLHSFFRSGSSHRLRIALNLKGLTYEYIAVNLRSEEHLSSRYKALNPQGFVPTLEADGQVLIQSPAIIEWLEERYPTPALLPADSLSRARVRALAAIVGCDIHPVNNLSALRYRPCSWTRLDRVRKPLPIIVRYGTICGQSPRMYDKRVGPACDE
jgi:maleylpyruvate isomerase